MALPLDVLEKSMNKKMSLQLKDGRVLEGKLVGYDPYMNLVLEDTEEKAQEATRRLGMVVLRGNNVISISILA
ncbi:MAG: LSM domain-containing protein [Thermoplasmatota archaeon]